MTYREHWTVPAEFLQGLCEQGLDALPQAITLLLNAAITRKRVPAEREKYLGAASYERTPDRRDYANGYKEKTLTSRVGPLQVSVPQVRNGDFYPSSLEKGLRSERALKIAVAEMYVQGVSKLYGQELIVNVEGESQ